MRIAASLLVLTLSLLTPASAQTYGERLGWSADDRVVILHVDDAGMSHDSNVGTLRAIQEGVANSMSVMMPCPWVPELVKALEADPSLDAGLHLTLTSEWTDYCWGPLAGKDSTPGLVDERGCMWRNVAQVVDHASPDEIETEIRAQLRRAREIGFEPTHLDSHMGTLFATPEYLERYLRVGADEAIPVMFPGGHNTHLRQQYLAETGGIPDNLKQSAEVGHAVWQSGLPVLDDLHNTSYGWRPEGGGDAPAADWRDVKVERYSEALRSLEPGVTMVIMHATETSENFPFISGSGPTRQGDLDAMLAPELKRVIEEEGLILTTWRELMQRRLAVGKG
jgi:hypothetical protein